MHHELLHIVQPLGVSVVVLMLGVILEEHIIVRVPFLVTKKIALTEKPCFFFFLSCLVCLLIKE